MKSQNNTYKAICSDSVMPSTFGYKFSITSNRNNEILGTGFFKVSRKMTRDELLSFFHQYTHGMYQNEEAFVSIDIFEAEA